MYTSKKQPVIRVMVGLLLYMMAVFHNLKLRNLNYYPFRKTPSK